MIREEATYNMEIIEIMKDIIKIITGVEVVVEVVEEEGTITTIRITTTRINSSRDSITTITGMTHSKETRPIITILPIIIKIKLHSSSQIKCSTSSSSSSLSRSSLANS